MPTWRHIWIQLCHGHIHSTSAIWQCWLLWPSELCMQKVRVEAQYGLWPVMKKLCKLWMSIWPRMGTKAMVPRAYFMQIHKQKGGQRRFVVCFKSVLLMCISQAKPSYHFRGLYPWSKHFVFAIPATIKPWTTFGLQYNHLLHYWWSSGSCIMHEMDHHPWVLVSHICFVPVSYLGLELLGRTFVSSILCWLVGRILIWLLMVNL